ncbi:PDR/VanB family oxidoreductase [Rhodococcus sp. IEGM 1366]|uniref:PDR/VanB family oxidoreductase n=1 Tax=Rhodococcus sp. IEGM 1366 TaxID=3082223 RepID=UPI00295537D9|nr:PDR/VanB family oxidoreductase [Rhodococcus sp. IEGM 1366]MDV8070991.1 PDR/VanB family oxidoreductase [Rhodococcus sp. IEGM 1366]
MTTGDPQYREFRVATSKMVADEIVLARLEPRDGRPVSEWESGAHVEIRLPSGLIRHYSLCGDRADRGGYEIAVLHERAGRGGSREFHSLTAGAEVGVGEPRNGFSLESAAEYLFIAGGVGITPILPMVRQVASAGGSWNLLYAGRSQSSMAFIDEVRAIDPDRVRVHCDDESGTPDFAGVLATAGTSTRIYMCGPGPMLDHVTTLHSEAAIPGPLHLERFAAGTAAVVSGEPFELVAQRSGVTVTVSEGQTILESLRPHISRLPFSCEEGYCGTCETEVIDGIPDHRDTYLDDDEKESGGTVMICVSRCAGRRLVLDL